MFHLVDLWKRIWKEYVKELFEGLLLPIPYFSPDSQTFEQIISSPQLNLPIWGRSAVSQSILTVKLVKSLRTQPFKS